MVTAPPATPLRGEDAACGARRLAPGLTARPGPLKRTVPAAGQPGSGRQVRAGRRGAAQRPRPALPARRILENSRKIAQRRFSGRHCARGVLWFALFPAKLPEKGTVTAAFGEAESSGFRVLSPQTGRVPFSSWCHWFSFIFSEIPFSGWLETQMASNERDAISWYQKKVMSIFFFYV